ncbi:hypothetical protein [Actinomadura parmotrematis]|uniref:Uncharacterized protein n=1 Tax=Actinomadura parmotrematis TaxID=2864039 RepID=A0ABS7FND9_9ACTN|nr:hypothetical protein [Actinomadura parmotrematis]MBW8481908.1 hypothetical protein [Actinomadura parmotrematis]
MTTDAEGPKPRDPFSRHRMRVITMSGDGRITSDTLQPWSAVSAINTVTGESPNFPAAEIPSGVIERTLGGKESLATVDDLRLELDGAGHAKVHDGQEELAGPGMFMVVEILPLNVKRSMR